MSITHRNSTDDELDPYVDVEDLFHFEGIVRINDTYLNISYYDTWCSDILRFCSIVVYDLDMVVMALKFTANVLTISSEYIQNNSRLLYDFLELTTGLRDIDERDLLTMDNRDLFDLILIIGSTIGISTSRLNISRQQVICANALCCRGLHREILGLHVTDVLGVIKFNITRNNRSTIWKTLFRSEKDNTFASSFSKDSKHDITLEEDQMKFVSNIMDGILESIAQLNDKQDHGDYKASGHVHPVSYNED